MPRGVPGDAGSEPARGPGAASGASGFRASPRQGMLCFLSRAPAPEPRFCQGSAVPSASWGARLCESICSLIWSLKNDIFSWQSKSSQGSCLVRMFTEIFMGLKSKKREKSPILVKIGCLFSPEGSHDQPGASAKVSTVPLALAVLISELRKTPNPQNRPWKRLPRCRGAGSSWGWLPAAAFLFPGWWPVAAPLRVPVGDSGALNRNHLPSARSASESLKLHPRGDNLQPLPLAEAPSGLRAEGASSSCPVAAGVGAEGQPLLAPASSANELPPTQPRAALGWLVWLRLGHEGLGEAPQPPREPTCVSCCFSCRPAPAGPAGAPRSGWHLEAMAAALVIGAEGWGL